jgi:type II secretory pathway component PulM
MKNLLNKKSLLKFDNSTLNLWLDNLQERLNNVVAYWMRLSSREQQLLGISSILIVLFIIFSIIGSAIDLSNNLEKNYIQYEWYQLNAQSMAKEYKQLNQITSNELSQVTREKVKEDIIQVLDVKNPDVIIADNMITINIANAKFELVILLLEQLRKSYGLFPTKLKFTRLLQSGFIAFNGTFKVEQ